MITRTCVWGNRFSALLIGGCLLAASSNLVAQSCSKVRAWEDFAAPLLETKGPTSTLENYEELIPLYKSEEFLKMAGRPYEKLSYRQRTKLGQQISKCSKNSFLRSMATYPLFERDGSEGHRQMIALLADAPSGEVGMAEFVEHQSEKAKQLAEAKARLEAKREREEQPLEGIPHSKGDLVLDGTLARLYFNRPTNHEAPRDCSEFTPFSLVFKEEVRDQIVVTESGIGEYVRSEIMPAIRESCPSITDRHPVRMNVFFEGIHLADSLSRWNAYGSDITEEEIASRRAREAAFAIVNQPLVDSSTGEEYGLQVSPLFKIAADHINRRPVELFSLPEFYAARAREFKSEAIFAAEQTIIKEQTEILGETIDDLKVWAVVKGGDYAYGTTSLKTSDLRDWSHTLVQAYGQSVVTACGSNAPGGTYAHEFKLQDPKTRRIIDRIPATLLTDLGDAGHAARGQLVNPLSALFGSILWLDYEAHEGPVREAFDQILKTHGCDSEVLLRIHKNILELIEHHNLK